MSQYLDTLNTNQLQAATTIQGYELMLAGAGTGKTHTLISRVAYMIEQGIRPEQILLLTFTKKAAMEMKTRLIKYAGYYGSQVEAGTFHSFIWNMMRSYQNRLHLDEHMRILDAGDDETLFRSIRKAYLEEKHLSKAECKEFPSVSVMMDLLSHSINSMTDIDTVAFDRGCEAFFNYQDMVMEIIDRYDLAKRREHYYNFDDLMMVWLDLLNTDRDFMEHINHRFPYVLCDEYQDTNVLQDRILEKMTCIHHNLCVVGDDNQSIYRFRAAEIENILTFEERHTGCHVIPLLENYRSTQEILDVSNAMMEDAREGIPKKLHGQTHGDRPVYVMTRDDRFAADYLVQEIQKSYQQGIAYKDQCILVRKALTSWYVEKACMQAKIPYQKLGGRRFTEEKNVKVILNLLRLCHNDKDTIAWRGVLPEIPGIGPRSVEQLSLAAGDGGIDIIYHHDKYIKKSVRIASQLQPMVNYWAYVQNCGKVSEKIHQAGVFYSQMLQAQLQRTSSDKEKERIEKRLGSLKSEIAMLEDMAGDMRSVSKFIDDMTLDAITEKNAGQDILTISTIHSAKGLEWEHVYVLHPIEEVFVDWNASLEDIAEERRVLYVALTRAKSRLRLVQAQMMQLNGRYIPTTMSSFLDSDKVRNTLDWQ